MLATLAELLTRVPATDLAAKVRRSARTVTWLIAIVIISSLVHPILGVAGGMPNTLLGAISCAHGLLLLALIVVTVQLAVRMFHARRALELCRNEARLRESIGSSAYTASRHD